MSPIVLAALLVCTAAVAYILHGKFKVSRDDGNAFQAPTDKELNARFAAEWTDLDTFVKGANRLWPSLQYNPFFWAGCCTSAAICWLGFMGAKSLANGVIGLSVLFCFIFVVANLVQAGVAIIGDRGKGQWYKFREADRSKASWALIFIFLIVNLIATIAGSSSVSEALRTTSEIKSSNLVADQADIQAMRLKLEAMRTQRLQSGNTDSIEAMQRSATEAERQAKIEALPENGGCKTKCRRFQQEATRLRSLADNAVAERELEVKIGKAEEALGNLADSGEAKRTATPYAVFVENLTDGVVTKDRVNNYGTTFFWILIAFADIALWLSAGDLSKQYRSDEYRRRAEQANEDWVNAKAGRAPRWPVEPDEDMVLQKALPKLSEGGDVTINLNGEDSKVLQSPRLMEIKALFETILVERGGSMLAIGRLYQAYETIAQERNKTYMTDRQFRDALRTYCEHVGIDIVSSQLVNYKLGASQAEE